MNASSHVLHASHTRRHDAAFEECVECGGAGAIGLFANESTNNNRASMVRFCVVRARARVCDHVCE